MRPHPVPDRPRTGPVAPPPSLLKLVACGLVALASTQWTLAADLESFEFNEAVVEVFPDMLRRSIPGYEASIAAIGNLARTCVKPQTHCYDLGCSLGAAALAMQQNTSCAGCRIIAVDSSAAMIARLGELLAGAGELDPPIELIRDDILNVQISRASLVAMNYTLQFVPPGKRDGMLQKIYQGLVPGGVLVLSEKVVHEDPAIEEKLGSG